MLTLPRLFKPVAILLAWIMMMAVPGPITGRGAQDPIQFTGGQIIFKIFKPEKGVYSETGPARICLKVTGPARMEFHASHLTSVEETDKLHVEYLISRSDGSPIDAWHFSPDDPLIIHVQAGEILEGEFRVLGRITLADAHLQPSGRYRGTLQVFVY